MRARRRGQWIGAIGIAGLALLGLAYWLTYEPAPRIRILWRDGVTPQQRTTTERKYLLLNGRDPLENGSLAYDLLDTSRSNIKALVEDPAIADTSDVDRDTYIVPFITDYGNEWMWIADRTPGLRHAGIRTSVIVALLVLVVGGFVAARR
jgi:hypothetical protein